MKKKLIPFFFSFLLSLPLMAENFHMDYKNFEEARKSATFFKFVGSSKKFGFVTTSFEGYARQGRLDYTKKDKQLENLVLTINTDKLDTDNPSRDEKLRDHCLETKKYPEIRIEVNSLSLEQGHQVVEGTMNVRGKAVPLKLAIHKKDALTFEGSGSFKLSDAGIPDPSIVIASVKDEFDIKFQVQLPE